ncbi:hypothetical protein QZH41_005706 [Actinostola sp. cb2023]|nr:hypothetical protein QZH41_005706 [Actinostola sp. cb2023]
MPILSTDMDSLKPPKPLSFEGNVADNWRRWLQQFNLYMNATGRDRKDEKIQYSTFLTIAGEDALEIYNTFTFEEGEANKRLFPNVAIARHNYKKRDDEEDDEGCDRESPENRMIHAIISD